MILVAQPIIIHRIYQITVARVSDRTCKMPEVMRALHWRAMAVTMVANPIRIEKQAGDCMWLRCVASYLSELIC